MRYVFAIAFALFVTQAMGLASSVSIADKGAVSDGKTLNTAAIQSAIDQCTVTGGGDVIIPPGTWLTGSIQLKSHVDLRLDQGAILLASSSLADYPTNGFKHLEMGATTSFIWAISQEDVSITGLGTIELVDKPFFEWNRLRTGLRRQQDALLEDWQKQQCVVTALARPNQPIFFHDCKNMHLQDVTIRNSPCWTIDFSCCDNIQIRGVHIENNLQVPNNDGIDFTGSKNITISDCQIRGGDDSLAFTSITDPSRVCEHITVSNCILSSRSAGVRIGHLSGKVRDVTISNVVIRDSNRGFAIQASDNGWVEDVSIQNVVIETQMFAGAWWGKGEPFVISAAGTNSGHIRHISISHVRARAQNSILIVGQNQNVSDITLDDLDLTYSFSANTPLYGKQFDIAPAPLRPSKLVENQMPWLYADDISGLRMKDVRFSKDPAESKDLRIEPVLLHVGATLQP